MVRLSRNDIEQIAERILIQYRKLPEVQKNKLYRIEPELLLTKVLGLNIEYQHLSIDGSILGLTSFEEVEVEIFDYADTDTFLLLDGKTVVVEEDLHNDSTQTGRFNFTLMHEGSHQIFKKLFPTEYGCKLQTASPVHYHMLNSEKKKPIKDWEEWQANTLAAAILLPKDLIDYGMFLFGLGAKIKCLNRITDAETYEKFSALADFLGASKSALAIRMKQLKLLEKEYLDNPFAIMDIFA